LRLGSYDCSRYLRRKAERLLSQIPSRGILEYSLRLTIACHLVGRLYGLPSETPVLTTMSSFGTRLQESALSCTCHSGLSAVLSVLVCAVVAYQLWSALEPVLIQLSHSIDQPSRCRRTVSTHGVHRQTVRSQLLKTLHMLAALSDTR
jgi:hypothetical protein